MAEDGRSGVSDLRHRTGGSLRKLAHNKKALAGLGLAGGLGAFVLLRRGSAAGPGAAGGTDGGISGAGFAGQPFDSTATDIAGTLGQYGAAQQVALDQYAKQLQESLDALDAAHSTTGQTGTGTQRADFLSPGKHAIGKVGQSYNLRQVAARGVANPNDKNAVEAYLRRLVAMNPSLKGRTSVSGGTLVVFPG